LDHHTSHLAHHDAPIQLYECILEPSKFFHRRSDLLEAYFL
jgi:hypothetical protein